MSQGEYTRKRIVARWIVQTAIFTIAAVVFICQLVRAIDQLVETIYVPLYGYILGSVGSAIMIVGTRYISLTHELEQIEKKTNKPSPAHIEWEKVEAGTKDDILSSQQRPELEKGILQLDIPLSGIEEIDNLVYYYDSGAIYEKYYASEAEEAFRKKCREKAEDTSTTRENKNVWIRRAINTLDTLFVHDDESIKCCSARLFAILESEFYQMEEPICIKKIGLETEAYTALETLKSHDLDGSDQAAQAEYHMALMGLIGGNIGFYEKKACDACELIHCPFRYSFHFSECPPSDEYVGYMSTEEQDNNTDCPPGMPQSLWNDVSKPIWQWAKDNDFVDKDYQFKGNNRELSLFAGCLSTVLFNRRDWKVFEKWNPYRYYAKTYSETSGLPQNQMSDRLSLISEYFKKPSR